jgi:PPOX class probable F420-dependent enzyme
VHRDLAISDLGDLVELPLVATLATYRRDGTVLLSPVWHEYRDGGFNVCTTHDDVKARHLRRDPRAVLLVAEAQLPYRGVELTTEATFSQDDVEETLLRVAVRYLGNEAQAQAYVETLSDDVVVRLMPGRVRAWDFADTF